MLWVEHWQVTVPTPTGPPRVLLAHGALTVEPGEIVALRGRSGCGKTTLARTLVGLWPGVSGELSWAGERIAWSLRQRARRQRQMFQLVFQDPGASLNPRFTIQRAVAEAVAAAGGEPTRIRTLLEQVGISPALAERHPQFFSGGERQRLALARALAVNPVLLIADEVTSNLDPVAARQVLAVLASLAETQKVAILLISHDPAVTRALATRELWLEDGVLSPAVR